jgi:hypothetical protein
LPVLSANAFGEEIMKIFNLNLPEIGIKEAVKKP